MYYFFLKIYRCDFSRHMTLIQAQLSILRQGACHVTLSTTWVLLVWVKNNNLLKKMYYHEHLTNTHIIQKGQNNRLSLCWILMNTFGYYLTGILLQVKLPFLLCTETLLKLSYGWIYFCLPIFDPTKDLQASEYIFFISITFSIYQ